MAQKICDHISRKNTQYAAILADKLISNWISVEPEPRLEGSSKQKTVVSQRPLSKTKVLLEQTQQRKPSESKFHS